MDFKGEKLEQWNTHDRNRAQEKARRERQDLLKWQENDRAAQLARKKEEEALAKELRSQVRIRNLKTAGKIGLGVAGAVGLGYGIKKAIDKNKDKERL